MFAAETLFELFSSTLFIHCLQVLHFNFFNLKRLNLPKKYYQLHSIKFCFKAVLKTYVNKISIIARIFCIFLSTTSIKITVIEMGIEYNEVDISFRIINIISRIQKDFLKNMSFCSIYLNIKSFTKTGIFT